MSDDDDEYPDGVYADDDAATVLCRYCREEIHEDADRCPHCGQYQSAEDAPSEHKSKTWIIMMILALLAAAVMTFGI